MLVTRIDLDGRSVEILEKGLKRWRSEKERRVGVMW